MQKRNGGPSGLSPGQNLPRTDTHGFQVGPHKVKAHLITTGGRRAWWEKYMPSGTWLPAGALPAPWVSDPSSCKEKYQQLLMVFPGELNDMPPVKLL